MTTLTMEQAPVAETQTGLEAAMHVLELALPLRDDPYHRERFYGEMGVVRTPLEYAGRLNGHDVYIKDETSQQSGSYKNRGASEAMLRATDENPHIDNVHTYSTGNHGRSVANAGLRLGRRVIVHVPDSITQPKEEGLVKAGVTPDDIVRHSTFLEAEQAALSAGNEENVVALPPFGDPHVVAGQCSLGFEVVEDLEASELAHKRVMVPVTVAGGGHIAGVSVPVWEGKQRGVIGQDVHVVGVQPVGTDTLHRAIEKVRTGQEPAGLYGSDELDTDCDALAISEESVSALTMSIAADRQFVEQFATMSKAEMGRALKKLEYVLGRPVEPAAALPMAYALWYADNFPVSDGHEPVTFVLPVSGGNYSRGKLDLYERAAAEEPQEAEIQPDPGKLACDALFIERRKGHSRLFGGR